MVSDPLIDLDYDIILHIGFDPNLKRKLVHWVRISPYLSTLIYPEHQS